jgi:MFS family permease
VIGCGVVLFSQITGQPSVLYFATDIFQDAGFGAWASLPSVGVGLVGFLATLFTVCQVDKYGRRTLLFVGITMMTMALAVLGAAFMFQECQVPGISFEKCDRGDVGLPQGHAIATALALMLYCAGYQVGFAPISRLLISEVFPLNVRGAAISIAVVLNFVTNIIMTLTQEVLLDFLTPSGVFFGYCGLALLSIIFVWRCVPETRGKSLEQIEGELTDRISRQQPQSKCNESISSLSTADSLALSFGGVFAREQGLSGVCEA